MTNKRFAFQMGFLITLVLLWTLLGHGATGGFQLTGVMSPSTGDAFTYHNIGTNFAIVTDDPSMNKHLRAMAGKRVVLRIEETKK